LRENPYMVRSGSELGAIDGLFSIPKLSVPKLSVPKMFSKSATKAPVPANAAAQAKAPAKAPVHEFTDLSGKQLLIGDKSMGPKMVLKKGYTAPASGDWEGELRETTKNPNLMYDTVQRKFCLSADCKKALACDWRHKSLPVYACLVLKDDILMLCFVDGDITKVYSYWKPFAIKNYITNDSITKAITVAKNWPKVLWFTKEEG